MFGTLLRFFGRPSYRNRGLFPALDMRHRHPGLLYLLDWLVIFTFGLLGGFLFLLVPVRSGTLFRLDDESIAFPIREQTISAGMLFFIGSGVPLIIMSALSLLVLRNLHDFHHAVLGLLETIALTLLFVSSIKVYVGGLRPNFLVRCAPTAETIANATKYGYGGMFFDTTICTGPRIEVADAMAAFPSGHAAVATAGLIYLTLYLNAKMKPWAQRGHMWIFLLCTGCIIGAIMVGLTRIQDYYHTWNNVLSGYVIGVLIGIPMYRLNYLSLFGEDNHVPVADVWFNKYSQFHKRYGLSDPKENASVVTDPLVAKDGEALPEPEPDLSSTVVR